MRETVLEAAVPAGVDPGQRACEIRRVREVVQSGAGSSVCPPAPRVVIRSVIGKDWEEMLRQEVNPRGVTPPFLDPRELKSLQEDPDLTLTWQALVYRLGLVRNSEFMATVSDAQGRVVWTGGNTKVRDEADRSGFHPGAQWAEMGTNGIRLVTQSLIRGVQIYGPEHWMDFQARWTCTAVGVFDPHTRPRRLLAVINVTGPWAKVHSDTLHESTFQAGDRVILPEAAGTAPGWTFLPALGRCVLEPLPALGWLVRPLRHDEDEPVIRVTLDLTDPIQPWVRVTGPNVSWHSRLRPLHATIIQRLAGRPDGLTPAELQAELYGAGAKTRVPPEMTKLRKELGGLLHPTSRKPGDRYRFGPNIIVDIRQ